MTNPNNTPYTAQGVSKNFQKTTLQSAVKLIIVFLQSEKEIAEPGNSNYLSLAHSTPQACFFMRGLHTPKENSGRKNALATVAAHEF